MAHSYLTWFLFEYYSVGARRLEILVWYSLYCVVLHFNTPIVSLSH